MINRFSASASEILLRQCKITIAVSSLDKNTFGKGTVQQSRSLNFVYDLDQTPLGVLQYIYPKFYRINGGPTQLKVSQSRYF